MGALDFQLGVADETTYGTAVTPARFFEFESESIEDTAARTASEPLRGGSAFLRSDRFTPYFSGAAGSLELTAMSKGLGFWLKHMLGAVATTGTTGAYTHTASEGSLYGKSLSLQVNRPANPTGTNQPFTYSGGKVTEWTLSNSVDENLILELGLDFQKVDTATALATPSYPVGMEPFTWAGGVFSVAGTQIPVTEISVSSDNGLNTDRRYINGTTLKSEPTSGRREGSFSFKADFDSLAQRARVHAANRAGALATIVGTWTAPDGAILKATVAAGRFDDWKGNIDGVDPIEQEVSGAALFNGTDSPIKLEYTSTDATP